MKRRKKSRPAMRWLVLAALLSLLVSTGVQSLLMKTNCLSSWPSCVCSWKGGKFVADCSFQSLDQVPNNDYHDYLQAQSGDNQMSTLNRDIQLLDLSANNITQLKSQEFYLKKLRNLQKLHLQANQLARIHAQSFHKCTGLVELNLSENLIASLGESGANSFLEPLGQLRVLNLASNRLTRVGPLAFSPLAQLRQLMLSNNRINYLDRRAFEGLGLLNVLHLDGNKLSHLDGDALLAAPQLHALRLAGANPWKCECRLRALLRRVLFGAEGAQAARSILQDEPKCAEQPAGLAAEARDRGAARLWTNMTLADFQCAPQLLASLAPPGGLESGAETHLGRVRDRLRAIGGRDNYGAGERNDGDNGDPINGRESSSPPPPPHNETATLAAVVLAPRAFLPREPLELTCPLALTDELDLELTRVRWWLLPAAADAAATPLGGPDAGSPRPRHWALLDYVTRANGSESGAGEAAPVIARVEHLVAAPHLLAKSAIDGDRPAGYFVCRVTNGAGQLDVIFPVVIDGGHEQPASVRRAKLLVRRELERPTSGELFIPVHLPRELHQHQASSPLSQTRSLNLHQTRPAARHTNSSLDGAARLAQEPPDDAEPTNETSPLAAAALSLIARYTSNRQSLIELSLAAQPADLGPEPDEPERLPEVGGGYPNARRLDVWLRTAARDTPLAVGVGAGLLVGCLVSALLVLRLRCARRRRVGDKCQRVEEAQKSAESRVKSSGEHEDEADDAEDEDEEDDDDTCNNSSDDCARRAAQVRSISASVSAGARRQLSPLTNELELRGANCESLIRRDSITAPAPSCARRVRLADLAPRREANYAGCTCELPADELNDGDVSAVSNPDDSILSQSCRQTLAGNCLADDNVMLGYPDTEATGYLVVAQPDALLAAGSPLAGCHFYPPEQQVGADGHFHLLLDPPKLRPIAEAPLCLLPFAPALGVSQFGSTDRRRRAAVFNCSSSIASPNASTSSSGAGGQCSASGSQQSQERRPLVGSLDRRATDKFGRLDEALEMLHSSMDQCHYGRSLHNQ